MAYKDYEIDEEYADEQHFVKVYFDFDTADECYAFASLFGMDKRLQEELTRVAKLACEEEA